MVVFAPWKLERKLISKMESRNFKEINDFKAFLKRRRELLNMVQDKERTITLDKGNDT